MSDRSSAYRPDIDGLRAIAVGVVVAFHAFPDLLPGGFVGVDAFFVISGYLISGIILAALQAGRFSFSEFYARRIRRIFPALAVVLAAVLAIGWYSLFADDYQQLGRQVAAGAGFSSNFLLWREASYFDTAAELKPLLHLWSLGIEEQFYLVWPLLLFVAFRWQRGPLAMTLALGAVSFVVAIFTVRVDPTQAFYAPWTRFWELLAGATLACVQADAALARPLDALASRRGIADLLSLTGIVMVAAGVILINATRVFPGLWVLLPVVGSVLLLVAGPRARFNRVVLSHPAVVWIGLISYPLYLWHWPLLSFSRLTATVTPPPALRLLAIAASVLLAWVTYRAIEWPARFGPRRRAVVPILSAAMVVMAGAGVATYAAAGFTGRAFNRSDAGHFIEYYERMKKGGLASAYRAECDYMDWVTSRNRPALDPSCTAAGPERTYFLWGDSFAQALSLGIREQIPPTTALAQVATSGCRVAVDHYDARVPDRRCDRANEFALDSIRRLRPSLVILAQKTHHAATDWIAIASRLADLGVAGVLVVGPFPRWLPTLPIIFANNFLAAPRARVALGLEQDGFAVDRQLSAALAGVPRVTYLSLLDRLCRQDGCLAQVPGAGELDLMALDAGHLTPQGSAYVGRAILKPYLDRVP